MQRALLIVLLVVAAAYVVLPSLLDRTLNRVTGPAPPEASERAAALFASLRVVDLHADSLLWQRDLSERLAHGQLDVPRLVPPPRFRLGRPTTGSSETPSQPTDVREGLEEGLARLLVCVLDIGHAERGAAVDPGEARGMQALTLEQVGDVPLRGPAPALVSRLGPGALRERREALALAANPSSVRSIWARVSFTGSSEPRSGGLGGATARA